MIADHSTLRSFRRRLFTTLSVLSLLLCVAIAISWITTPLGGRLWSLESGDPERWLNVLSIRNRLEIFAVSARDRADGTWVWKFDGTRWWRLTDAADMASVSRRSDRATYSSFSGWFTVVSVHYSIGDWVRGFTVHYSLLPVISALLPAYSTISFIRLRKPSLPGHCPTCGYDLRVTPDRCPECGTERGEQLGRSERRLSEASAEHRGL